MSRTSKGWEHPWLGTTDLMEDVWNSMTAQTFSNLTRFSMFLFNTILATIKYLFELHISCEELLWKIATAQKYMTMITSFSFQIFVKDLS